MASPKKCIAETPMTDRQQSKICQFGAVCSTKLKIFRKTSQKSEMFFDSRNTTQNTTIYHAIHHNFTTIDHHKSHQNLQNPLQKQPRYPSQFFSAPKPQTSRNL